jgi:hypothetical protein
MLRFGGGINMNEKTLAQRPTANCTSDGERKFVLEDVFWVPISNSSQWRSTSSALDAPRPEKLHTSEGSISDKTESGTASDHR